MTLLIRLLKRIVLVNGRSKFENLNIKITHLNEDTARRYLLSFVAWLEKDFELYVNTQKDTDLLNTS
jgi:hypothetical protein